MNVLINWSGGKDSTTSAFLHLNSGHNCYIRCFIPMFTKTIPMITKKHQEFIYNIASRFKDLGASVDFVYPSISFYDWCAVFGYPYFNNCGYRSIKIQALSGPVSFEYDFIDIGIAYDEPNRFKSISGNKISILVEHKFTENDCFVYCYSHNALSPHYLISKRDGCSLCPNATDLQRQVWLNDYPEAIPLIRQLDVNISAKFTERYKIYPLRGYKRYLDFLEARPTASPLLCSEPTEQPNL